MSFQAVNLVSQQLDDFVVLGRIRFCRLIGADGFVTRAAFDQNAPGMDWNEFFTAARLAKQPEFILWHPKAVTGISAQVAITMTHLGMRLDEIISVRSPQEALARGII